MSTSPAGIRPIRIETSRAVLALAAESDAPSVLRYYTDNRPRFEPLDPERPPVFYEERFWRAQIRMNLDDFVADRAVRLFVFPREEPERVIGNIGFFNIVRGVAQYCTLGYGIDEAYEGKGMMSEALRAAIAYAFGPMHLHRIEANHLPDNERSAALLRRLGFVVEGYSKDYLRINGTWRDHVRTALINPHWRAGAVG